MDRIHARHSETGATASFTETAFVQAWSKVGWVRADDSTPTDDDMFADDSPYENHDTDRPYDDHVDTTEEN